MSSAAFDAIVIGAGANGLTAAGALGRAGSRVVVLEAQAEPGGLAAPLEFAPGFRCVPFGGAGEWVPPVVARGLDLRGLERIAGGAGAGTSVAVEPGTFLHLPADPVGAAATIGRFDDNDAAAWPDFTRRLHALTRFLEALYAGPAPDIDIADLGAWLRLLGLGRRFRALGREGMIDLLRTIPMSVQQLVEESIRCEPLRAAVAARGVHDSALGPKAGGTGFLLLHGLTGAPAGALGGCSPWHTRPDAFIAAALNAAQSAGVTIRTDARVARIDVDDHVVIGVTLVSGEEIRAPRVLSSADPVQTLLHLVDPVWLDPELLLAVRNIRFHGCTASVMYGLDALPRFPGLDGEALRATVSLTARTDTLERAADALKYGRAPDEPHIELSVPTLHWQTLAPPDHHVVVARVQYAVPPGRSPRPDDPDASAALTEKVSSAIDAIAPGFSNRIRHQAVLTPADVAERWGLTGGALSHGALMLDQILFMRPIAGWSRYAMPVRGLYLCGAGAHPGPGIAGAPGWLAARRVLRDAGRPTRRAAD